MIATHHGPHVLRIDGGTTAPISEHHDDFMGLTAHSAEADILDANGHPAGSGNLGFIAAKDGGKTWETLSADVGGPIDFYRMDVSKADPKVIYGAYVGLQVGRDSSRSWHCVGPTPEGLIDILASARDAARLFAATQQGLFISQDGGKNWLPAHSLRQPTSVVETNAGGVVCAWKRLAPCGGAAIKLADIKQSYPRSLSAHLAVDPDDHDRHFTATQHNELVASRDGGQTWRCSQHHETV